VLHQLLTIITLMKYRLEKVCSIIRRNDRRMQHFLKKKVKNHLRHVCVDGKIILKVSVRIGKVPFVGSCEHGNKPSSSVKVLVY
jgi:hypothetical protein